MLGIAALILLPLAVLSGGLVSLFAGRRLYPVWLGFATYTFTTRILDLALFRFPESVRNWGGLVIAILVGLPIFTIVSLSPLVFLVGLVRLFLSNLWTAAYRQLPPMKQIESMLVSTRDIPDMKPITVS